MSGPGGPIARVRTDQPKGAPAGAPFVVSGSAVPGGRRDLHRRPPRRGWLRTSEGGLETPARPSRMTVEAARPCQRRTAPAATTLWSPSPCPRRALRPSRRCRCTRVGGQPIGPRQAPARPPTKAAPDRRGRSAAGTGCRLPAQNKGTASLARSGRTWLTRFPGELTRKASESRTSPADGSAPSTGRLWGARSPRCRVW